MERTVVIRSRVDHACAHPEPSHFATAFARRSLAHGKGHRGVQAIYARPGNRRNPCDSPCKNVSHGRGTVWFMAFHPGLAYFRTALPDTEPPCKGSTDDSYNHWNPTDFDATAADVLYAPVQGVRTGRNVLLISHMQIRLLPWKPPQVSV